MTYQTIDQALNALRTVQLEQGDRFRGNAYKELRESWCVATALAGLGMTDCQLKPEADQSHSIDTHVKDAAGHNYRFQVIEIHPRNTTSNRLFADTLKNSKGYGELKAEVVELVSESVTAKNGKYAKADMAKLNLLIYFNAPSAGEEPWASTIILNFKIDLDRPALKVIVSDFGSVIFMTGSEVEIIKGQGLTRS